jgi:hypothetical protein
MRASKNFERRGSHRKSKQVESEQREGVGRRRRNKVARSYVLAQPFVPEYFVQPCSYVLYVFVCAPIIQMYPFR